MTDEQLTALAREYAEEINPVNQLNDCPEAKVIADIMRNALSEVTAEKIKDFEGFIRFLLRRFYLVEKSKVEEVYKNTKSYKSELESFSRQSDCCSVKLRLLESLFPEIAKEVEE